MPIDEVLDQLVARSASGTSAMLEEAVNLLEVLDPGARVSLTHSFTTIALRALEARLLADHELRSLALYWRARAGSADDVITRRVEMLTGAAPSIGLRQYLRSCIRSRSSREGQKEGISPETVLEVVEGVMELTGRREIRCQGCGYHFLLDDLGAERQTLIAGLAPIYAITRHPRRLDDQLKPWQINGRSLTSLTIDHLTPEAGLGWTGSGNHAILCYLCNQAKAIYRSPSEPISTVVAASLQACPAERPHSRSRQIAVWAIIASVGRCMSCAREPAQTELTVILPEEHRGTRWLVPWAAEVVCYECVVAREES